MDIKVEAVFLLIVGIVAAAAISYYINRRQTGIIIDAINNKK